ncbi:MAG: sulfur carrier protein ThiS [Planctomycetes bacterium]|nr:sulfur carrier protein ThiS [Planctomycetota bacterium]
MRVTVNGQSRTVGAEATVADLVGELGFDRRRVAVERNRLLVRRAQFDQTALAEGDVLEIVTLVGGG